MIIIGKGPIFKKSGGAFVMIRKYTIIPINLFFIVFLLTACEVETLVETQDSLNPNENPSKNTELFFSITNEFQDHKGSGPLYLLLKSVDTDNTYIIPPTKYISTELEYVIVDMEVEGECVRIPSTAFPLAVHVCESSKCTKVRSLDVLIKNPAHYNLNGLGGLLTPQINPVSPCSPEFIQLVDSVEEFTDL